MIFIGGKRLAGRVEVHAGTFIATEFVHMYYMPLIPMRSHLVLETTAAGGIRRSVAIPLHASSVVAGYLRTWSVFLAVTLVFGALAAGSPYGVFLAGIAALVAAWSWFALGRLGAEAKAQRAAYAALTHEAVDAALLCRATEAFRGQLLANVAEGARGMMATGYRTALDPQKDWAKVALDPTVTDLSFLQACLTLTRIDWGRAKGAAKKSLAEDHGRIWEKLKTLKAAERSLVERHAGAPGT